MSYHDLLDRMQRNDTDAFLEMTDRYGWSVYSAIREKYSDAAFADKVYNETMNVFYHSLSASSCEDPLEALLCAFATRISSEKPTFDQTLTGNQNVPPKIQLCHHICNEDNSQPIKRKKKSFMRAVSILMFLIAVALMFWYIAYLLMEMNYIPYFDLGYSWFQENVLPLFLQTV